MKKVIPVYLNKRELNLIEEKGLIGKGRNGRFSEWIRDLIYDNLKDGDIEDEIEKQKVKLLKIESEKQELEEIWKREQKRLIELESLDQRQKEKFNKMENLGISLNEYNFLKTNKNQIINSIAIAKIKYEDYKKTFNKQIKFLEFSKYVKTI